MLTNDELRNVIKKRYPNQPIYFKAGKKGEIWNDVRNYDTVLYPEHWNDLEEMYSCIRALGVPASLSPLHDKDIKDKETGEIKKPHYHLVVQYSGKTTPYAFYIHLCGAFGEDGFFGVHIPNTLEQGIRYQVHLDNPEKAQYNVDEVVDFNGFCSKPFFLKGGDFVEEYCELMDLIDEKNIIFYNDLLKYLRENDSILFAKLVNSSKLDGKIHRYMRSREHQMTFDGHIEVSSIRELLPDGKTRYLTDKKIKVV